MWILPKSLTCRFAPGTEALTSDCADASRACEQSLMRRSKPSRASSFSREWKAGNLTRLRSGLISSLSLGESFADWWTSSLADTRASHSQPLESDSEAKTRDTSGRLSQAAFEFFNLESACLRTSRATLPKGCITSCLTWEDWVTEQRGEFSRRLSAARLISGSGSLSWPTATTTEAKSDTLQDRAARGKQVMLCHAVRQWPTPQTSDQNQAASPDRVGHRLQLRDVETGFGRPDPESRNTDGSRQELWPTATATNRVRNETTMAKCAAFRKRNANQSTVPLYLEEKVRLEQAKAWPTPSAMDGQRPSETPQQWETRNAAKKAANPNLGQLHRPLTVAAQWATPEAKNQVGYQVGANGTKWPRLGSQVQGQWTTPRAEHDSGRHRGQPDTLHSQIKAWPTPIAGDWKGQVPSEGEPRMLSGRTERKGGKLNPRWVETLMGLPVGWTMPSCASPVTIEPTSCDCSATESCQQQPSSPSAS